MANESIVSSWMKTLSFISNDDLAARTRQIHKYDLTS